MLADKMFTSIFYVIILSPSFRYTLYDLHRML